MNDDKDDACEPSPKIIELPPVFRAAESGFAGANEDALQARLRYLELEHRDLDIAIATMANSPAHDRLALARLKKRKLAIKDMIQAVKDQLTPDIIA
jgi:hypothetical protein